MPDRPFPAVEALVRRVQRGSANRPDPLHILAQTISMAGTIGLDPYAVLGLLVEGAVQTLIRQIPAERQADAATMLIELPKEFPAASHRPAPLLACQLPEDSGSGVLVDHLPGASAVLAVGTSHFWMVSRIADRESARGVMAAPSGSASAS
jgi:hypothetical protein